jgi:NTE family protein
MVRGKAQKFFGPSTKIVDAILASSASGFYLHMMEIVFIVMVGSSHFPTDVLQGQCETIIGIYVSPIQKLSFKI